MYTTSATTSAVSKNSGLEHRGDQAARVQTVVSISQPAQQGVSIPECSAKPKSAIMNPDYSATEWALMMNPDQICSLILL